MHLLMAGTRLNRGRGKQQCNGEESEDISVNTEEVKCVMCLWGALRIVRVTEGALLGRLHDIAQDELRRARMPIGQRGVSDAGG